MPISKNDFQNLATEGSLSDLEQKILSRLDSLRSAIENSNQTQAPNTKGIGKVTINDLGKADFSHRLAITTTEFSALLGVAESTVRKWCNEGAIQSAKLERQVVSDTSIKVERDQLESETEITKKVKERNAQTILRKNEPRTPDDFRVLKGKETGLWLIPVTTLEYILAQLYDNDPGFLTPFMTAVLYRGLERKHAIGLRTQKMQ
jgi:DNA-binding transcriptional regulator YiaG